MNLNFGDWTIVTLFGAFVIFSGYLTSKLMKSVADFLAAGRTGGRYLLSVAQGIAGLGAITVVGIFEMNLNAGFCLGWWGYSTAIIYFVLTALGWVIYRFRKTRALTLAQFFEMRYSRGFRIFAGIIAYVSGIINMGIFPAVEARFFMYFCGLPNHFHLLGLPVPTFPVIMLILLAISLYFVFAGGQITVMIADFLQGAFANVVFVIVIIFLFATFPWTEIQQALSAAPANASLINPFQTGAIKDFNFWYFLIGLFGAIYCTMSWQGTQAYNVSAKSAHEAKVAGVVGTWRGIPQGLFLTFVPIIAYTILHHPKYAGIAGAVDATIKSAGTEAVQSQLKVPVILTHILPKGLMGAFAAMMFAASVTTLNTYLHSWGSILIQDVVMPIRRKPFSQKNHINILRASILGVAVFVFFFSLIVRQTQLIFLFFAITGAIFAGGSGAVIIGGLYWKRGTNAAAWAAMIAGSTIAVAGIIIHQVRPGFSVNGQWIWAIAIVGASVLYILVSLLGRGPGHDMDKLLHRGAYAVAGEDKIEEIQPSRGLRIFGISKEFSLFDRVIYFITYAEILFWTIVFWAGTLFNLTHRVSDMTWMQFWRFRMYYDLARSIVVVFWFTAGGFRDLKTMVRQLKTAVRDHQDDGFVRTGQGEQSL